MLEDFHLCSAKHTYVNSDSVFTLAVKFGIDACLLFCHNLCLGAWMLTGFTDKQVGRSSVVIFHCLLKLWLNITVKRSLSLLDK